MTTLFAKTALLPEGWADNVLIEYDRDGWIIGVDSFKPLPEEKSELVVIDSALIPGMPNAHSLSFQKAIAGLAERATAKKENFWSWRETMYRSLHKIEPEDIEAIAAQVYVEMLKAGYTTVGEFHYVHHKHDGSPYKDRSLLSRQILKAALETGIAITHMPTLYAYSDFGKVGALGEQKRFINTVPELMNIIETLHAEYSNIPQITLGFGHHSLRAVSPEMLKEGTQAIRSLIPDAPIHMHLAEQAGEVERCIKWSGKRPIEWLLENEDIDDKWTLIHCIQANDAELKALAESRAVVALCPTAEANMGDGIFRLLEFFEQGGRFAIGSGSNISINMIEDLRWLEYGQRMFNQARTLINKRENPSTGAVIFENAVSGGAQSLGRKTGKIVPGYRADFLVLDQGLPFITGKVRDHILDAAIFASNRPPVKDVMVGGHWVVKDHHHKREEVVFERFCQAMSKI